MSASTKILVADQSLSTGEWVKAALEPQMTVVGVTDPKGLGAAILRERPNLVLVDVTIPAMDAAFLSKAARCTDTGRRPPLVLFAALPEVDLEARVSLAGADSFICKDVDSVTFRERLEGLLAHGVARVLTAAPLSAGASQATPKVILTAGHADLVMSGEVFGRQDLKVVEVKTAAQVMEELKRLRPALLVVGSDLIDLSAAALVRRIRGNQTTRQVSILAVESEPSRAELLRIAGINDIVASLLDGVALREAIVRLVNVAPRRDTRLLIRIGVRLTGEHGELGQVGYCHNLSATGMLLEGNDSVSVGDRLGLRFFLPARAPEIAAAADVVRVHSQEVGRLIVGVQFVELSAEDREAIALFVEHGGV